MHDDAIAWAESITGSSIAGWVQLPGAMTSTMLALTDESGGRSVLRLMTNEPWRAHGAALTRREQSAQRVLATTLVPAPISLGLDPDGVAAGVSAHLMSRMPGAPVAHVDDALLAAMSAMLTTIHDVQPAEPFRIFESWAWEAKWTVPEWTRHPVSWQNAFELLAADPPAYCPTFLHRDFSHRNLLWDGSVISGVVDWVETSTGPAWLDVGHAATNLAIGFGPGSAEDFLAAHAAEVGEGPEVYWLIMDAVGFLPPPGRAPMFSANGDLARLDDWLHALVGRVWR